VLVAATETTSEGSIRAYADAVLALAGRPAAPPASAAAASTGRR
jgi:hypothetical protein